MTEPKKAPRPRTVLGATEKIPTGCGNMYVTVNEQDGKPFEVFGILGKAGQCTKCQTEGLTRLMSLGLRYGVPAEEMVKQLRGIICPSPVWDDGTQILSCPDAIACVLHKVVEREQNDDTSEEPVPPPTPGPAGDEKVSQPASVSPRAGEEDIRRPSYRLQRRP